MKFSIITASYNQAPYIERSLASVQAQTFRDFEHIIHDGLSSDGSQELLRAYAAGKSHVRLVIEKDGGQVQAINSGLKEATGEILTWLNTDDFLFDAQVLECVAKAFDDPEVDVVYGRGWYVDQSGEKVRDVFVKSAIKGPDDLISSLGVFQPALYFRRRVFERLGGLDPKYQLTLDYEYWIRMLQAGIRFKFLDVPLAKATLHEDSKTVGSRGRQLVETLLLVKDRYGYVHPDWIDRYVGHLLHQADWTSKAGRVAEATRPQLDKLAPDHELCFLTDQAPSRLARNNPSAGPLAGATPVGRLVVTSFNSHYFAQGLNLVTSLHVHAGDAIDRIVVYDLGLTESQRGLLDLCEGVVIERYPAIEPWPGYYSPKSYMYKCHAIYDARRHCDSAQGEVLWIDAGVCVTGSLDAIFARIQAQGVFLVNHDDRRSRTMVNGPFTHPIQTEALGLDRRELSEDHVCSCVLGYRIGTVGEDLVAQVVDLSLREDINRLTKHPEPKWQRATLFQDNWQLRACYAEGAAVADPGGLAHLAEFPYYGHRQDQSLYSNLAARMGLPVSSALRYCPATDYSSKMSFENWKSGGEANDIQRAAEVPEGHAAPLFHHRGTFSNLAGLLTDRSRFVSGDVAFVLGNGPSLKNVQFTALRNVATVGMNAAYRYWDECGWYPSYYCCMDTVVILSHAEAIRRLILGAETYGIRYFFLRKVIAERYPDLLDHPRVLFLEDIRPLCPLFQIEPITTGSYSLMFMVFLGFRRIYLAGVDCNYVERISGISDGDKKNKLVVVNEVKSNPNYFFDSYQRPGDEYNVPNPSKDLHVRSWRNCAAALEAQAGRLSRVRVINLNQQSKVDCFENSNLATALHDIGTSALDLAKAVARSFGPTGNRTALIEGVQAMFAKALGGTAIALTLDHGAASSDNAPRLKVVQTSSQRMEVRLEDSVLLSAGEFVAAVLEFNAPPAWSGAFQVLHVTAWKGHSRLRFTTASSGTALAEQDQSELYIHDMGNGRQVLAVNLVAARNVRFEGLALESETAGPAWDVIGKSLRLLSLRVYEPQFKPIDDLPAQPSKVEPSVSSGGARSVPATAGPTAVAGATRGRTADGRSDFSFALSKFREGRYDEARAIAIMLSRQYPDFKWYRQLIQACDAKSRR